MAKAPNAAVALPRLDKEEKTLDVRVRLKGRAAIDLADYQKFYEEDHGETYDTAAMIAHILTTCTRRRRATGGRGAGVPPAAGAKQ